MASRGFSEHDKRDEASATHTVHAAAPNLT